MSIPYDYANYKVVEICGRKCLFTKERIHKFTLPTGIYLYELRHGNGNFNRPETIEKSVRVDYFGTILTNQEFTMAHSDINPNDEFVHINKLFKFTYEDEIKGKDVYKYFKDVKI